MPKPQVKLDVEKSTPLPPPAFDLRAWRALIALGLMLGAAGLTDILLAFYPSNLSDASWRFTTFVSMMNGLPVLSVGVLVALMASLALGHRTALQVAVVANLILAGVLVIALIVIATAIAPLLSRVLPGVRIGIWKAAVKGILFALVFGAAHVFGAMTGIRAMRAGSQ